MPRLSVWAVRLALLYLLLGFTLGAIILANKGVPFAPYAWRLLPMHIDILLFGFVIQLAMGVGYWILPRYRGGGRGNEGAVRAAVVLLNLGVWAVIGVAGFNLPMQWMGVGRLLEGASAGLFVWQVWKRIRPT